MSGVSAVWVCVGFFFWLAMAYFYYQRNLAGALVLAVLAAGAAVWAWLVRRMKSRQPTEEPPPAPVSDLPDFDFENVKPKDFE